MYKRKIIISENALGSYTVEAVDLSASLKKLESKNLGGVIGIINGFFNGKQTWNSFADEWEQDTEHGQR